MLSPSTCSLAERLRLVAWVFRTIALQKVGYPLVGHVHAFGYPDDSPVASAEEDGRRGSGDGKRYRWGWTHTANHIAV